MSEPTHILELSGVTVESEQGYDSGIWNISLRLAPGELALVRLERGHLRLPIADAAEGMIEPTDGTVHFLGEDWQMLSPDASAARRGRVGRVFDGQGWISGLDVDENVLLAERHHTSRTSAQLADEAAKLARMFGLPGLPRGRPSQTRPPDLQRAACVRALLGKPDLIILERPTQGLYPEILPPLVNAARSARNRGAAVLWLTEQPREWSDTGLRPTWRCVMSGSQMLVSPGEAPSPPRPDASPAAPAKEG